jgi:hypothetical protein
MIISIGDFSGMMPIREPILLPDPYAQYSRNTWLYKGGIRGFRLSQPVFTLQRPATSTQVYRIVLDDANPADYSPAGSLWLEFPDDFFSVLRNPTVGDQFNRYYFFPSQDFVADNGPWMNVPFYAPFANIQAGGPYYVLGIPAPNNAPLVTAPPVQTTKNVTAISAIGSSTLTLNNTTNVVVGMTPTDLTNVNVSLGTSTVQAVVGNVVTITGVVSGAAVAANDQINFLDLQETRAYVYTYISAYSEEGPPSPPTVVAGGASGVWNITVYSPSSADMLNRNITGINIYRTVTDSSGNATFFQVNTSPLPFNINTPNATIGYIDAQSDNQIANNLALYTTLFTGPPPGLQGVVMMANGIMAGWTNDREIWFSAAYYPHAWPDTYALTVDFPIVGMAAIGTSLNIITEGQPFIATGLTPDTMTIGKVTANEPGISRGSIFPAGEGVYYASPNGLILLNTTGTINTTQSLMEREFWATLQPEQWACGRVAMTYMAVIKNYTPVTDADFNGLIIDHLEKNVPFSYFRASVAPATNLYWDQTSGQMFYISQGVVRWANPPSGGDLLPWEWISRIFRMPKPMQIKAFKVSFTVPPEVTITPPTAATRNNDQNQVFDPTSQYLIVRVYRGVNSTIENAPNPVVVREVVRSEEEILIPGGFKDEFWTFEMEGQVNVILFKAASSVKELQKG